MHGKRITKGPDCYYVDGVRVPRVTELLDWEGLTDFRSVPADILERARLFGTAAHLACHFLDIGTLDFASVSPAISPIVDAYEAFKEDYAVEIVASELAVGSKKYMYAGTLDKIALVGKKKDKTGALVVLPKPELAVIDLKSTAKIYPATEVQVGAYEQAYNEGQKVKSKRRMCLLLKTDGTYEVEEYSGPQGFRVFLAALTLHNWKYNHA